MSVLLFLGRTLYKVVIILALTGILYTILLWETPNLLALLAGSELGEPGKITQFLMMHVMDAQKWGELLTHSVFLPILLYILRRFFGAPGTSPSIYLFETWLATTLCAWIAYAVYIVPLHGVPDAVLSIERLIVILLALSPAIAIYLWAEFLIGVYALVRKKSHTDIIPPPQDTLP